MPAYWWPASAGYGDGLKRIRYAPVEAWTDLLPALRKVGMDDEDDHPGAGEPSTNLWRAYRRVSVDAPFAMRKVKHRRDIYPVFRELFARRPEGVAADGA